MALLHVDFFSEVLGMCTQMTVILPQKTKKQIGMTGVVREGKYPVMYLLHGMTDDHTTWLRRTSIERYVSDLGVAVVMPTTYLGWYTDTDYGMKYWKFFSQELPTICQDFFPIFSDRREDILAAGNSMGGYGAWKLGLGAGSYFGAAASLSGALDIVSSISKSEGAGSETEHMWKGIFRNIKDVRGSEDDLWELAKKCKDQSPRLYAWCGKQDFLYEDNIRTWEYMESLGMNMVIRQSEGTHDWKCWDTEIQNVLKWWLYQKEK